MGGSLLTQEEIDALLQADSSQPTHEELGDFLTEVVARMESILHQSLGGGLKIEGPYLEQLTGNSGQVIAEENYITAADLGPSELFLIMPAADADTLGDKLALSAQEAMQSLSGNWLRELSLVLKKNLRVFQTQKLRLSAFTSLPLSKNTVLARHLINFGNRSLELAFLIQGTEIQGLLEQSNTLTLAQTQRTSKPISTGRLLGGHKSPVSEAAFSPLELPQQAPSDHTITLVEDITLLVTVELGHTVLTLNEVLELRPQQVIALTRHVGEAVDLFINDKHSAKGEVVVLEEHFGVRLLEIIPKSERLHTD